MAGDLIRAVAQAGLRIFDRQELMEIAIRVDLKKTYVPRMMNLMVRNGEIVSLGNGLYSLPPELLAGGPLHSFEIAMKVAKKGAISHRSAMAYYQLTDQVFAKVYITVPREKGANLSRTKEYNLQGTRFELIRIEPQHYWGIKPVFLGEARVWIADLEKTLIDGLSRPELCGGFREVLFAFEKGIAQISPILILEYAKRTSLVACKRLGWVLEQLDMYQEIQEQLMAMPMPYCQRLDAAGKRAGKVIHPWNLLENI
jgi:predicted transcriptional regulator of viral defense system